MFKDFNSFSSICSNSSIETLPDMPGADYPLISSKCSIVSREVIHYNNNNNKILDTKTKRTFSDTSLRDYYFYYLFKGRPQVSPYLSFQGKDKIPLPLHHKGKPLPVFLNGYYCYCGNACAITHRAYLSAFSYPYPNLKREYHLNAAMPKGLKEVVKDKVGEETTQTPFMMGNLPSLRIGLNSIFKVFISKCLNLKYFLKAANNYFKMNYKSSNSSICSNNSNLNHIQQDKERILYEF